jgi:mannose-6-phosphate isomerase
MSLLYPLRFRPLYKQYMWGGRRFETSLGRALGPGDNYAESWEICDHGADQSLVSQGPLAGATLRDLVTEHGRELLGRNHPQPRFPLIAKFLDARQTLSVQVHPNDDQGARLNPPDSGKTEAWIVLEAGAESLIYAGLKPGVDRSALESAIRDGRCADCLHSFHPQAGDCVFIPAGTVHSMGAGILAAEIQQSSDTTFRLFDWNRLGPDGKPRALHIEQGLQVINYEVGPVNPQVAQDTGRAGVSRIVTCDKFVLDRLTLDAPHEMGGDDCFHILTVLEGSMKVEGDPGSTPISRGNTVLMPACLGRVKLLPQKNTVVLDAFLPNRRRK